MQAIINFVSKADLLFNEERTVLKVLHQALCNFVIILSRHLGPLITTWCSEFAIIIQFQLS
jgi:hypothetical protein